MKMLAPDCDPPKVLKQDFFRRSLYVGFHINEDENITFRVFRVFRGYFLRGGL